MAITCNDILVEIPFWDGVGPRDGLHALKECVLVLSSGSDLLGQGKRDIELRPVSFENMSAITWLLVSKIIGWQAKHLETVWVKIPLEDFQITQLLTESTF